MDSLDQDDADGEENFHFDEITPDIVFKEFYTVQSIQEEQKEEIKTCEPK